MPRPDRAHTRSLTSILLEAGVVTPDQVDAGLVRQRSTGLRIGETLVELGAATEEDIGWALARQLELPFVDLLPEALDRSFIQSFPDGLLQRLEAVPLLNEDQALAVALADPLDPDVIEELEREAGRPIMISVATPSSIRRVLRDVLGARHEPHAIRPVPTPAHQSQFDVQWERSGASFLLFHVVEARRAGASEIHFVPRLGSLEVHHRLAGRLVATRNEPPGALDGLLARIEALGGPTLQDSQLHAAGRVVCAMGEEEMELGASLLRQPEGVSITLELRPAPARPATLAELGIDPVDLAALRAALGAPAGLGIVTGPPRAGGSTLLACLLAEIGISNRRALVFGQPIRLAGPVLNVPGSRAEAARAWADVVVAQCADIAVLDGVLAGEEMRTALSPEAAGRLVLVRTDWTDTFALLEFLAARAQDRTSLAARLRFVVQPRVVHVTPSSTAGNGLHPDRRAVYEVLVPDDSVLEAIRSGGAAAAMRARAVAGGWQSFGDRLQALVASGALDSGEAARHAA